LPKIKPFVIGVTGGSGSGKTYFIRRIKENFSEEEICVLSLDNYYKARENQNTDKRGVRNFDLPDSIDKKDFHTDLTKLIQGEVVNRMEYTFNNELVNPDMLTFKPAPIIIVEGLFVFHYKRIRELLDLKIYLHAKENLKIIRRIKRDKIERNYPLDDVLYRYEKHVMPTFEKYIQPYIEKADLVINNNKDLEKGMLVLIGFLKQKLLESS